MDAGVYFNSLGAPLLVSLDNQTSGMKKVFQNFNNNVTLTPYDTICIFFRLSSVGHITMN